MRRDVIKTLFPLAVLFALCVNHFDGFEQDSILYTLQAINHIFPGRFTDDPAFMFGNQDAFSFFSIIYSSFIKVFPIDIAALVLTLLIHSALAVSFAWFSYKWTQKFHCQHLALPIVLFFFSMYAYGEFRNDMWSTIKTIEAYPVARTFAVCFGFWGLAHLFDRNRWISLAIFLAGSLVHPITVGWGFPLWLFYHFPKTRLPVIVAALLFPATVFIGKIPWAAYPSNWVHLGWDMDGIIPLTRDLILNFLFLILASVKFLHSKVLKKFALAETFVVGIAIYWFVTSIFTHHIFLFQVQTFRILWLCQVSAIFIQFLVGQHLYVTKISRGKAFNIWEKVFLAITLAYWIDSPFVIVGTIIAAILHATRNKPFYGKIKMSLFCVWVAITIYAAYWIVFLHKQLMPEFYQSCLTFIQELFATAAAFAFTILFACPKYRFVVIVAMFFCTAEILWGNAIFPKQNFSLAFILAVAVIATFIGPTSGKKNLTKILSRGLITLVLTTCALLNYDHRDAEQKEREYALNQFVNEPPFPNIEKRGRVLFSVKNYAGKLPRIHFLSGAYYDEQYEVGDIFFRGHKDEAEAREKKVFLGTQTSDDEWKKIPWQLRKYRASEYLFNKDSLIVRTQHLCQNGEITHLITDFADLPFAKNDSLTLWYKGEKVYLHSCQAVNN